MAARALKLNHYDPATGILKLTAPEAHAYRQQLKHWTDYFLHPETNGGLKAGLVTDPAELSDFTAFVTRSEEHTSELQSLMRISYDVFCLKNKNKSRTQLAKGYRNSTQKSERGG